MSLQRQDGLYLFLLVLVGQAAKVIFYFGVDFGEIGLHGAVCSG
jgi:hypothetical protein